MSQYRDRAVDRMDHFPFMDQAMSPLMCQSPNSYFCYCCCKVIQACFIFENVMHAFIDIGSHLPPNYSSKQGPPQLLASAANIRTGVTIDGDINNLPGATP